jgi:hypothetical protein
MSFLSSGFTVPPELDRELSLFEGIVATQLVDFDAGSGSIVFVFVLVRAVSWIVFFATPKAIHEITRTHTTKR